MKRLLFSISLAIVPLTFCFAQQNVPVILVAGQSNADGRVPLSDLPDEFKTFEYCQWSYGSGDFETATGHFSPFCPRVAKPGIEMSWGFDAVVYHLLGQQWQQPFYVIKQTMGGTAIDTTCVHSTHGWFWSPDAGEKSLLKAFCRQIDACLPHLPKDYDIKCLIWHQGESDQPAADRYYDNLKDVITYVRQHLAEATGKSRYATLPVVCGTFAKGSRQGSPKVVEALYKLQRDDDNFHVVEANDLSLLNDQLHFDAKGAVALGHRVFQRIMNLPPNIWPVTDKSLIKSLNGEGVNAHSTDPYTVKVISDDLTLKDMRMMKEASVNYMRLSHYPREPRFYELADSLGFYLVDVMPEVVKHMFAPAASVPAPFRPFFTQYDTYLLPYKKITRQ